MRPLLVILLEVYLTLAVVWPAAAFERAAALADGTPLEARLSPDCLLAQYNFCSGWIWIFDEMLGAVWGTVLDPNSCPGGCATGGAVEEVYLYSRCQYLPAPGLLNGIDVESVDGVGCPTALLYHSGPVTITHCVSGDRWTRFLIPLTPVYGLPFAVTIEWGPQTGGYPNPILATDNGFANLYCSMGVIGFPGCATTTHTCTGWVMGPQVSFIYITDINGDTVLEDLCALYGVPYGLAFPYVYGFGYITNNLAVGVGLDCSTPTAVEPTSWGRVKALFE